MRHIETARRFLTIAVLLGLVASAYSAGISIDPGTKYQTMRGFGASTAWGSSMSAADADLLWSTTTGAGLSLHRIRIAPDQTTSETNIAKLAIARGATIWATPWTPASSMKAGEKKTNVMGLLVKHQEYADKLLAFVKNMKNSGVPIYAISAQNEPDASVDYESCKINPDSMALWVGKYLGPTFAGSGVKVMSPESQNWYGLANYWPKLKASADAMKYMDIVATHEYGGNVQTAASAVAEIKTSGKDFWETEIYDMNGTADVGMGSALRVYALIHEALTAANMNAWHYWWVYPSTTDNGALWDKATNKATKRLWVMGNYSRFVRPGYVRIGATASPATGVTASAYLGGADEKIVIVAANTNSSASTQSFTITGRGSTKVTPWVTDDSRSLVSLPSITPALPLSYPVPSSSFSFDLPPKSVTTLVVELMSTSVHRPGSVASSFRLVPVSGGCKVMLASREPGVVELRTLSGKVVESRAIEEGRSEIFLPVRSDAGVRIVRVVQGASDRSERFLQSP